MPEASAMSPSPRLAHEARANERYHGHLERQFSKWDHAMKCAMSTFATMAFAFVARSAHESDAGTSAKRITNPRQTMAKVWSCMLKTHAVLRREWTNLRTSFDRLQRRAEFASSEAEIKEVRERCSELFNTRGFLLGREPAMHNRVLFHSKMEEVLQEEAGRRAHGFVGVQPL